MAVVVASVHLFERSWMIWTDQDIVVSVVSPPPHPPQTKIEENSGAEPVERSVVGPVYPSCNLLIMLCWWWIAMLGGSLL